MAVIAARALFDGPFQIKHRHLGSGGRTFNTTLDITYLDKLLTVLSGVNSQHLTPTSCSPQPSSVESDNDDLITTQSCGTIHSESLYYSSLCVSSPKSVATRSKAWLIDEIRLRTLRAWCRGCLKPLSNL